MRNWRFVFAYTSGQTALYHQLASKRGRDVKYSASAPCVTYIAILRENELPSYQVANQGQNIQSKGLTEFLNDIGLSKLEEVFIKQEVDFHLLLKLSNEELKDVGIAIFGQRKKILTAAERFKSQSISPLHSVEEFGEGSFANKITFLSINVHKHLDETVI